MNSTRRRIVTGLAAVTAMAAGVILAPVAGAAVTGSIQALPSRLLVGLRAGVAADVTLPSLQRLGLPTADGDTTARRLLGEIRAKAIEVPSGRLSAVTAALKADPNVEYVQVDPRVKKSDVTPNDPWIAQNRQPELAQMNVPAAWDTTTGSAITVAVVDTGVNTYGDLAGKVLPGYDFANGDSNTWDDEGHGTMVSSLIAATPNNGKGLAGVCAQCKILPVKALDRNGDGFHSDIAKGIIYAAQKGAKIINLSLGGTATSAVLKDAVAYANGKGVLVVAAAGNESTTRWSYPAAYADVLAVGATDTRTGGTARTWFSNYGNWVDVAAPGITAAMKNNGVYCWDSRQSCWVKEYDPRTGALVYDDYAVQGTSFSAPLVAGVAALVASRHPSYSGGSLRYAIISSARKDNNWTQYGTVDAAAALTRGTDTKSPTATGFTPAANAKVRGNVAITPTGLTDDWFGIRNVNLYVDGKWHSWDYVAPFAPVLKTGSRNGAVKVQLLVYDKAGNHVWLPARWYTADNLAPTVSITKAPANKARVKGTVKVYAKAADKSGISKVELIVNGKVVAKDTTAGYVLSFKVASQKKTMKVRIRAYDKAGNVKYTTIRTYYRS
ncbi:S8 family serine peptidase [Actinoplanes philippinensis]|uniref:S8 family serine peptidase n=1 Tax=Actinoplanes philippinensis TaxID=35752 RepID=UPI0033C6BE85